MRTKILSLEDTMRKKNIPISALLLCGVLFSGCETANSLLTSAGFTNSSNSTASPVVEQSPPSAMPQRSQISVAPVVGPPDDTSRALQTKISTALQSQKVSVANQFTDPSDFTLRGYVVAAKDKNSAKLSYIWDVTDASGKRINRISGEELAALSAGSNDVWSAITPQIIDKISTKTVSSVVAWLPTQNQSALAPPIASVSSPPSVTSSQVSAGPLPSTQKEIQSSPLQSPTQTPSSAPNQATGSIAHNSSISASVPQVTGAPGNGGIALSEAIQRELTKSGISLSTNDPKAYTVAGSVTVGSPKDGKQPVTIDWNVQDPTGKKLGTVSQKNEVPQGSLDGAWGKTADAAAAAAAQGIIKLLPKTN